MEHRDLPIERSRPIDLSDFKNLHDTDFIYQAYRQILIRDPDPSGEAHYLSRLRAGHSKSEIIFALTDSPEGKLVKRKIVGRTRYRVVSAISSIPIFGRLFEAAIFILYFREFMRDIRALENYVYRIKNHLDKA